MPDALSNTNTNTNTNNQHRSYLFPRTITSEADIFMWYWKRSGR